MCVNSWLFFSDAQQFCEIGTFFLISLANHEKMKRIIVATSVFDTAWLNLSLAKIAQSLCADGLPKMKMTLPFMKPKLCILQTRNAGYILIRS